ncbi:hypothetical protein Mycsm_04804 [Mycobacterium sp. JS623]|uniref:DUF305 domain-containing protein n=1 Tax=Mycobacterium sp. JS623 TaxID=212767 RepID=UPI0002A58AC1|nr:DUF305 domain-containing protein [Mycobacterium sp. JS623]AGB25024.1 hypothetical protein Mycsm_04804 [Mycobacterium sp. JS623]
MWKRTTLIGVGALAALAISTGCSSSNEPEHPAAHSSSASATAAPTTSAVAEAHNDADVMFAQHMIPHHQQAVEMSDMVLGKQGIDARVTELANQIKAAQGPEIQLMQGWLTQWGTPAMPAMSGHDMPGVSGMMSNADMTALTNAQGVEASKLFLTQMIAHHEGAITMAQKEIKDGQYPAAIELAKSIVTAQQKEIDTMKGIVATL